MVGRQKLYADRSQVRRLLQAFGHPPDEQRVDEIFGVEGGYAEGFLEFLGAQSVNSLDYSSFEGATLVHDMNRPISRQLTEQFSTVLDGGTLEHIFNFPISLKNCMEMVRVGGHYLAITPANNFLGHGFYQFSPELYFSTLSADNGFALQHMYAFEETARPTWYSVRSPSEARGRVTLTNSHGVYLLIIAKRVARKPIFERTPQQSDYLDRWGEAPPAAASEPSPRPLPIRLAKAVVPAALRRSIRSVLSRSEPRQRGFDPRFFQPFDPTPTDLKRP
jgi:hypothetical protein